MKALQTILLLGFLCPFANHVFSQEVIREERIQIWSVRSAGDVLMEDKLIEYDAEGRFVRESGDLISIYSESMGKYYRTIESTEAGEKETIFIQLEGEDDFRPGWQRETRVAWSDDCSCRVEQEWVEFIEKELWKANLFGDQEASDYVSPLRLQKPELSIEVSEQLDNPDKASQQRLVYTTDSLEVTLIYARHFSTPDLLRLKEVIITDTVDGLRRDRIYDGWATITTVQERLYNEHQLPASLSTRGGSRWTHTYEYTYDQHDNWTETRLLYRGGAIERKTREIRYY